MDEHNFSKAGEISGFVFLRGIFCGENVAWKYNEDMTRNSVPECCSQYHSSFSMNGVLFALHNWWEATS